MTLVGANTYAAVFFVVWRRCLIIAVFLSSPSGMFRTVSSDPAAIDDLCSVECLLPSDVRTTPGLLVFTKWYHHGHGEAMAPSD